MRLGLLGVTRHSLRDLMAGVELLLARGAERIIYLGPNSALDAALADVLSPSPSDLWQRAADRCHSASADEIDAFVGGERRRLRYKVAASLPGEHTLTIELLAGKVVVLVYDKDELEEEDIAPAALLVFGKANEPVLRQIGSRWFLSPGSLATAGVGLLAEASEGVHYTLFNSGGEVLKREQLNLTQARVKISD